MKAVDSYLYAHDFSSKIGKQIVRQGCIILQVITMSYVTSACLSAGRKMKRPHAEDVLKASRGWMSSPTVKRQSRCLLPLGSELCMGTCEQESAQFMSKVHASC